MAYIHIELYVGFVMLRFLPRDAIQSAAMLW